MSEVLLSQLAHVELVSPNPEETVSWMVDVLGLERPSVPANRFIFGAGLSGLTRA